MAGTASLLAAGYGSDGVYRSPRPAAPIPSDPALSLSDPARPPPRRRVRLRTRASGRRDGPRAHLRGPPLRGASHGRRAVLPRARPPRRRRAPPRAQLRALPGLLPRRHRDRSRRHHGQPALHPTGDRQADRRRPCQAHHHRVRHPAQDRRPPAPHHPPGRRWRRRAFRPRQQRHPLLGPRRRRPGDGVPPPSDAAERHGSAVLLVRHDGGEQGRRAHPRQLHRCGDGGDVGPGRARGRAQRVPLLPAYVPHLLHVRRHARAAAARQNRRRDGPVRRGRRARRRGAPPRHVPLLRAAGHDRTRQAREGRQVRPQLAQVHRLRRRAARQGRHGSRGRQMPPSRDYPGLWYDRNLRDDIAGIPTQGTCPSVWFNWNTCHWS
uniref:Uncharacterized protein n=1 Tax=Setaria viridis TaxID=4556 RepID=A0A4U6SZ30_SETVI|nr:hypothetical protein SEVIR_9G182950v2 [Setaria viridis]TKV92782.1 hypothetical protein SEVIR_9G182950v2 [Setaria viridis]